MNSFISSQFTCALLWMCHSRLLHTQINNIRALHIVCKDNTSFEVLLEESGSLVKIHCRNLQYLAVEI